MKRLIAGCAILGLPVSMAGGAFSAAPKAKPIGEKVVKHAQVKKAKKMTKAAEAPTQ